MPLATPRIRRPPPTIGFSVHEEIRPMRTQMFSGVLFTGIVTIALAAVPLSAQMDHGQMHGATQGGMQHGAMMASTDQMMKNIDQMMSSSASMMRDLTDMQAGMHGNGQGQMTTTMQGMLDNMKQMHGQLLSLIHISEPTRLGMI